MADELSSLTVGRMMYGLAWYGVWVAALTGLVSGLILGIWLVVRFCEVHTIDTERWYS